MGIEQRKDSNTKFVIFNIKLFTKSIKTELLLTKTWFQNEGIALSSPAFTVNDIFFFCDLHVFIKQCNTANVPHFITPLQKIKKS